MKWHHYNVNDYTSVRIQINLISATRYQGWALYIQTIECGAYLMFPCKQYVHMNHN